MRDVFPRRDHQEEMVMMKMVRAAIGMLAASAVCAGVADPTVFGAKPVSVPDIPIQVTFRNATLPPDRLLSDSVSPSYTNGYTGVQATIAGSTGSVHLFTCFSSKGGRGCASQGRAQTFDFRDPLNQYLQPPVSMTTQGALMQIWVFGDDGVTQLPGGFRDVMRYVGDQRRGGSKTNFYINGTLYTVRFTPNMYANSDYLLVTYLGGSLACTTADPSKCATWTVEAGAADGYGDIAEFVRGDNSIDYGQFHMPFKITVSVLPK
jgi:hypothetical protein